MGVFARTVVKSSAAALCGVAAILLATTVATPSYAQSSSPAMSTPMKMGKAAKPGMAKKAMADAKVMSVQEALIKQGYKVKVDGMMGKKTRSALRKFQAKNKLKATGRIDEQTLAKLGVS
ncbi:MAG: peptidoglycan-binding protein [Rhodospirillales bacterium]